MSTLDDIRDCLAEIHGAVGDMSIQSDGEVRRRISSAVIEAKELLAELEAESDTTECRVHARRGESEERI